MQHRDKALSRRQSRRDLYRGGGAPRHPWARTARAGILVLLAMQRSWARVSSAASPRLHEHDAFSLARANSESASSTTSAYRYRPALLRERAQRAARPSWERRVSASPTVQAVAT